MNEHGDVRTLTWSGGPTFRLTRTALALMPAAAIDEAISRDLPPWARHPLLVRRIWQWRIGGPHPLGRVALTLDGTALTYRPPRGPSMSWRVPPEAAAEFIGEVACRRALRMMHRVEGGRGRSLVPLIILVIAALWLLRRARRS